MQLVDVVRGLTRPLLTFGLVGLVGAIYFLLGAEDTHADLLRPRIIETVLYVATAAVLWWLAADREAPRLRPALAEVMSGGEVETWVARAVIVAVVGACVGLFVRMRGVEKQTALNEQAIEALEGQEDTGAGEVAKLRKEMHDLQLCIGRNYISREDWVPHASRVMGALERHGELLSRLDERTRPQ